MIRRAAAPWSVALALLAAPALVLTGCQASSQAGVRASGSATATSTRASASPTGGAAGDVGSGLQPGSTDPTSGLRVVSLQQLPPQAAQTVRLVQAGGPFPYHQDGVVYHNYNRVLPARPASYYHEYTVRTPGAKNRGARRIIHGQGPEYYWTSDHYNSFQRIA